jgi:small subunit ribosomal protein S6
LPEGPTDRRKEVVGNVNPYEILLMLDPELAEERQSEIVARVRELVERGEGTWLTHEPWGRRRLAYEIDHKTDGAYHLVTFDARAETLDEISRVLKIADEVMRFLAVRRIETKPRADREPDYAGANTRSRQEEE